MMEKVTTSSATNSQRQGMGLGAGTSVLFRSTRLLSFSSPGSFDMAQASLELTAILAPSR